jgi:hypothetical protein
MKQKDEPIRVAQIMGKLWAGGVEMVVFNYYRAIDKSKIQFDFYYDADSTVEPPQNLIDMGARFYKIPPYQKLPQYIRELKKHLKENQYAHFQEYTTNLFQIKEENLWLSSIRLSRFFRRSLSPSAQVSQCGVLSTSWKATATTTPAPMLMCDKVTQLK